MEKLSYAVGGWVALNVMLVIVLLNRRPASHTRHRLARWAMGTPRPFRRRHLAHALISAAHGHH
jgi:hypothetical protein